MKKAFAIALSIFTGSLPAQAQIPGFQIHRIAELGDVYFTGPANSEITVAVSGRFETRTITADACGLVILRPTATRPTPTEIMLNDPETNIVSSSLPVQLLPKCLASGQLEEPRTANFKTPDGIVVVVGRQPSTSTQIFYYGGSKDQKVKINACGFGRIKNSPTKAFVDNTSFTAPGGTPITHEYLPEKQNPYLCKDGILYIPQ